MKKYEFNELEISIIKKGLEELLEIGLSEPQEEYIRNIDGGMSEEEASTIYTTENKKYWKFMIREKKDPLYTLYYKLFGTPEFD